MKNVLRTLTIVAALLTTGISMRAQQVNTLYFLDNAPMRHLFNPALQPVSKFYINLSPLGYSSFWAGNNSLTMSDLVFVDPLTGKTITALHPNADREQLLNAMRPSMLTNMDFNLGLLNMGVRVKEKGYLYIDANLRTEVGISQPKAFYSFLLGGGLQDLTGANTLDLSQFGIYANAYLEVGAGYSHRINDQLTVGGKLKALLGYANVELANRDLQLQASIDEWRLQGQLDIYGAASPLNVENLPSSIDKDDILSGKMNYIDFIHQNMEYLAYAKPCGLGAAIDLGATYSPLPQLQITAAITDLGFINWQNGLHYQTQLDMSYSGIHLDSDDYINEDGLFDTDLLMQKTKDELLNIVDGASLNKAEGQYRRMPTARLNIGIDGRFWDNRVGVGVLSQTRLTNGKCYEEVTLGASFKPFHWLNLAASYSFLQNGKNSHFGAAIGIMPYDGIQFTLATDYAPTSYIVENFGSENTNDEEGFYMGVNLQPGKVYLPYKTKGLNLVFGFSICVGSQRQHNYTKQEPQELLPLAQPQTEDETEAEPEAEPEVETVTIINI